MILRSLKLLLPALIPSWRFFDVIAPSPRIEFALLRTPEEVPEWREFRPRPAHLSFADMLQRMVWNPAWNESLFLVSCAERLMDDPDDHSRQEIFKRIKVGLKSDTSGTSTSSYLKFRLVFVSRQGDRTEKHVAYISSAQTYSGEQIS